MYSGGISYKKPKLIEVGVSSFLRENLKQCKQKKGVYINKVFNVSMFIMFFSLFFMILYYKYKGKLTPQEKHVKHEKERIYILNKVKSLNIERQKVQQTIITNLPTFDSDERIKGVLPMTHPSQLPANYNMNIDPKFNEKILR